MSASSDMHVRRISASWVGFFSGGLDPLFAVYFTPSINQDYSLTLNHTNTMSQPEEDGHKQSESLLSPAEEGYQLHEMRHDEMKATASAPRSTYQGLDLSSGDFNIFPSLEQVDLADESDSNHSPEANNGSPLLTLNTARLSKPTLLSAQSQSDTSAQESTSVWNRMWRSWKRYWRNGWHTEYWSCCLAITSLALMFWILKRYENQHHPQWPLHITINSMIAILTAFLKAGLALPLSEGRRHVE